MAKKEPSVRLGRGLAALLGDQASHLARSSETPTRQLSTLPIDVLAPSSFQPRQDMNADRLAELADSIRSRGVLQPLLVRPDPHRKDRYQIIAGERRWRASQMAGLHEVPVHIRSLNDTDAMAAAIVENLQRSDLNPVEEAEGLQRLLQDYHLTQEELAGAVGKSRSHITNTIRLLNLPEAIRRPLRDGRISAGHARALLAHPDPVAALAHVLEKGLNVRQTEALTSQTQPHRKGRSSQASATADIMHLEEELTRHLGLKTRISFNGKGGTLKIHYDSFDQVNALLHLLRGNS